MCGAGRPMEDGPMSLRSSRARLVLALSVVTALLVAGSVAIALAHHGGPGLLVTALAVGFTAAGGVIALQRRTNPIGWIFLGSGIAAGVAALSSAYAEYWVKDRSGPKVLGELAACYGSVGWIPFILVPSIFVVLLFPHGHEVSPSWRWIRWMAAVGIAGAFVGGLLLPGPLEDTPELDNPLGVNNGLAEVLQTIGFVAAFVAIVGSGVSLVVRFRRASGAEREQLKWLAYAGAIVAVTVAVAVAVYDVVGASAANAAIMISVLTLPAAIGIAIVRHQLYDVNVVISRTLAYALLTVTLAAAYGAVSLALGVLAGSGSTVPTAAGTLAVAFAFRPVRGWIQGQVDRRFDRVRYEALHKIECFQADLRAGVAAPEATGAILAEALGDPSLDLYFRLPDMGRYFDVNGHAVTEVGSEGRVVTPVRRGPLELGCIAHDSSLAARPNLLTTTIGAAGLAIEIARLRVEVRHRLAEVEQSRARIVTVGDEERRRLERNLHDGAQQRLVSLGLSLRDIQSQLPDDSETARELDGTVAELTEAIDELRELASGVRPASLDDGLAAALRELAARSPLRTRVTATEERFDDSIETAVYFVCSEALANATKHARATAVAVDVARRNDIVTVFIRDDGIGGADPTEGSGLVGLSDRVAALGGTVLVESPRGKGTTITAELPCG